jgi:hypothetical protein
MDRMFAIIPDITEEYKRKTKATRRKRKHTLEKTWLALIYADDTMIPEDREENMEALLWVIEDVSEMFGLKLNKSKCPLISEKQRTAKFKDGTVAPQTSTALYLGTLLHQTANPRPEIIRRINGAAYVRRKLDLFWRKAELSKRRKVIMYEALISAKMLYALETLPIHQNMYDRIDAAYYKGLRQIMDWKTTFGQMEEGEDRTNTNERLIIEQNKITSSRKKKKNNRQQKTTISEAKRKNQKQSNRTTRTSNQSKPRQPYVRSNNGRRHVEHPRKRRQQNRQTKSQLAYRSGQKRMEETQPI